LKGWLTNLTDVLANYDLGEFKAVVEADARAADPADASLAG
jgi:hypothetical protein